MSETPRFAEFIICMQKSREQTELHEHTQDASCNQYGQIGGIMNRTDFKRQTLVFPNSKVPPGPHLRGPQKECRKQLFS